MAAGGCDVEMYTCMGAIAEAKTKKVIVLMLVEEIIKDPVMMLIKMLSLKKHLALLKLKAFDHLGYVL